MEPREPREKIKDKRINFSRSQSAIRIVFFGADTLSATNVFPIYFWLEIAKRKKHLNVHGGFFFPFIVGYFYPGV